jgi:hypothetical protein
MNPPMNTTSRPLVESGYFQARVTCALRMDRYASARMRDLEVIDSELRLLAAVRRVCREQDGVLPSIGPVDELLDERRELDRKLTQS